MPNFRSRSIEQRSLAERPCRQGFDILEHVCATPNFDELRGSSAPERCKLFGMEPNFGSFSVAASSDGGSSENR